MSEAELVLRAKRGDRRAYETLVRQYERLAFRTAYVLTGDARDAEEAAQSGFLKAFVSLPRFRGDAPFRPWLLRIVSNEAHNARRSRMRHARHVAIDVDGQALPSLEPDLDLRLMAGERSAWLVAHINELSETDRIVIHCRYTLDLSELEIAQVLGCARGTVKSRLSRALGRLRQRLDADPRGYREWAPGERE